MAKRDVHDGGGFTYIKRDGGRKLAFASTGDTKGPLVILSSGTPTSGRGPKPRNFTMCVMDIHLVGYDRPGYGESDRNEGRTFADDADDMVALADALEYERFSSVGRSGGGGRTLALGARHKRRVHKIAVLSSLVPRELLPELPSTNNLTELNARIYNKTPEERQAIALEIGALATETRYDPNSLLKEVLKDIVPSDERVIGDRDIQQLLLDTYAEAVRKGPYGWIDDVLATTCPSGFAPSDIEVPTYLWWGKEDKFTTREHGELLMRQIPHAEWLGHAPEAEVGQAYNGHFNALEMMTYAIAKVAMFPGSESPVC